MEQLEEGTTPLKMNARPGKCVNRFGTVFKIFPGWRSVSTLRALEHHTSTRSFEWTQILILNPLDIIAAWAMTGSEVGLEWVWSGSGVGLEWVWRGSGVGLEWVWNGSGVGPVWVWYGSGMGPE
jgi:hypothetical protein